MSANERLAYLAPQITALSTTFVYKEILGLERRGYRILPFSVHPQTEPARKVETLSQRVVAIYARGLPTFLGATFNALLRRPAATLGLFAVCLRDIAQIAEPLPRRLRLGYQMLAALWLSARLRENEITHLHIHFGDVPAQIGMYAARHAGIPFTVTFHANDLFEHARLLHEKTHRAAGVATISAFNRERLLAAGAPVRRLRIVRCGIDPREFPFQPRSSSSDPAVIGVVARLVEKKGIDVLLHATARLTRDGQPVRVSIAGSGPLQHTLRALTDELGIAEQVEFIGPIDNTAITAWMSRLDLFVLPARKDRNGDMDGIPVALMEAMALGVPVVSTRLSGIPELVVDGESGLLAEPGDAEDLARAMTRLLSSPELRDTLVQEGRRRIESEFSQQRNLDRLERLFEEAEKP